MASCTTLRLWLFPIHFVPSDIKVDRNLFENSCHNWYFRAGLKPLEAYIEKTRWRINDVGITITIEFQSDSGVKKNKYQETRVVPIIVYRGSKNQINPISCRLFFQPCKKKIKEIFFLIQRWNSSTVQLFSVYISRRRDLKFRMTNWSRPRYVVSQSKTNNYTIILTNTYLTTVIQKVNISRIYLIGTWYWSM